LVGVSNKEGMMYVCVVRGFIYRPLVLMIICNIA